MELSRRAVFALELLGVDACEAGKITVGQLLKLDKVGAVTVAEIVKAHTGLDFSKYRLMQNAAVTLDELKAGAEDLALGYAFTETARSALVALGVESRSDLEQLSCGEILAAGKRAASEIATWAMANGVSFRPTEISVCLACARRRKLLSEIRAGALELAASARDGAAD